MWERERWSWKRPLLLESCESISVKDSLYIIIVILVVLARKFCKVVPNEAWAPSSSLVFPLLHSFPSCEIGESTIKRKSLVVVVIIVVECRHSRAWESHTRQKKLYLLFFSSIAWNVMNGGGHESKRQLPLYTSFFRFSLFHLPLFF